MSWKNTLYILLVIFIAGGSALAGGLAGGAVVYRTLQQQPADQPAPLQEILPTNSVDSRQTLMLNATDIETAITQAVQQVGPTVVTVVGTVRGQMGRV